MTSSYGDVLRYGDETSLPANQGSPIPRNPMIELGQTGLKRATGIIDEEFLPALRGRKAVKIYREMSQNDPMVGAMLFAIDKLLRQVTWRVEAADNTPESTKAADFVEQCMDDMSHTWNDMISEILSCLVYGFSWHEVVYKKRVGPWEKDPKKKSKYDDGMIGWRKIPIRGQETLLRWIFDEQGGIQAMVQIAPPYYQMTTLPINKSLLFRTGLYKGNPEGMSILRTAYRPWFMKKRLEEFEAIGVERDLAGMPVAKVPSSYMRAEDGTKENMVFKSFKKMVQNVRRDEHEGLVLPNEYDPDTKQPLFEFELMAAGGSRSFDTNALIQRYEQRILMTCLADFIMVGHEDVGSYALHVDKTGIFRAALNVISESIADVFNRHAIPRLFELNAWKPVELPRIVPNNVDPPNLAELTQFMGGMAQVGMQWFPDPELEKFLRDVAHLPELPDELLDMRRQMALETNVMDFAQTKMEFEGMRQKIDAVKAGYSPEQAQLAAESPNPDMQEQEAVGQAQAQLHPAVQGAAQQEATNQMAIQGAGDSSKMALGEKQDQFAANQHARDGEAAARQMKLKEHEVKLKGKELSIKDRFEGKAATRANQLKAKDHERGRQATSMKSKEADKDLKRKAALARLKKTKK